MPRIRWSSRARTDFVRIAAYWQEQDPERLSAVVSTIRKRAAWIADGNYLLGARIGSEATNYRWSLEREFGYKIYYRVEGTPVESIAIIAVRHGRQRPLKPSTLRRYAK